MMRGSTYLFRCILIIAVNAIAVTTQTVYSCNRTATCGCSRNSATISRIVGGEAANDATWGWVVSIAVGDRSLCGGSILSPSWIISAAHCFDGFSATDLVIYAGSKYRWTGSQNRTVSRVIMHTSYNSMTFENDIALLYLSAPLSLNDSNVNRICLPPTDNTTDSSPVEWPPADTSVRCIHR